MSEKEKNNTNYFDFHLSSFWDKYYNDKNFDSLDFYFDISNLDLKQFQLYSISKNSNILIIGPGTSKILNYFDSNRYQNIHSLDFSQKIIEHLRKEFDSNSSWAFYQENIFQLNKVFLDENTNKFDFIIDKACIDCILSDPTEPEISFRGALKNIMKLLKKGGKFYYFSYSKIVDRINYFYDLPNIKIKCEEIKFGGSYNELNDDDNSYSLFILEKTLSTEDKVNYNSSFNESNDNSGSDLDESNK